MNQRFIKKNYMLFFFLIAFMLGVVCVVYAASSSLREISVSNVSVGKHTAQIVCSASNGQQVKSQEINFSVTQCSTIGNYCNRTLRTVCHSDFMCRVPCKPGDANLDRKVDIGDLGIFGGNYGKKGMEWKNGDFTGDGQIDVGDLGVLGANYGKSC